MQGWIKLHRELTEKAIWTESTPQQKVILITLLTLANHKQKEWEWQGQKYKAKPGQFVTSLPKIAEKSGTGITIQNVRTALKRFEKYEFLTDQSTALNRLITIVNWGFYQGEEDAPNRLANRQLTDYQQTTNRLLTANKNDKNNKNEINKDTSNKNSMGEDFEKLWKLYPKKTLKKDGFAAYKKAIKNGTTNKEIQDGIIRYKKELATNEWQKPMDGGRWFKKRRWEDEFKTENTGIQKYKTLQEAMEEG
ncbi:DNA replication protein DnaD [Carnobacterium maltaromaticum]|uniref:DNA replication protein DnaD n=1 Tax=Carnobacterium maltaromaticum TaxID=2751 RepID=UPI00298A0A74|nr:DNA replication protein DnaD [Carnobacterium maltaromaticum]MDW5524595.1 DNA replication protein DnaD [Carnobacterium maltaromaticum]